MRHPSYVSEVYTCESLISKRFSYAEVVQLTVTIVQQETREWEFRDILIIYVVMLVTFHFQLLVCNSSFFCN